MYNTSAGSISPLGAVVYDNGVNFAVYSSSKEQVSLCLFENDLKVPKWEFPMHQTKDIWHLFVENLPLDISYAFRKKNGIYSDPYALALTSSQKWGEKTPYFRGKFLPKKKRKFEHPKIPFQELIVYEMHVRGFTQDSSSHAHAPGTFEGIVEKIPYLKALGVNAIELLPVYEFDENSHFLKGKNLFNYWGYSSINFFSLMPKYAAAPEARRSFWKMVDSLHSHGMEVILDVVYNHATEGGDPDYALNFRGLDNDTYYIMSEGNNTNYSGCGNTLNCNQPIVRKMILDSLRYWVEEMGVDGFRFDLASILTRGENGDALIDPPLIEEINHDPILKDTRLIAEAWDAAGLYQVGKFHWQNRWAEWNGFFRDQVRRFIRGDGNGKEFAEAMMGSPSLYAPSRKPYHSINFITCHDGFTMNDLVSYSKKHNEANGEENRDGSDHNESANYGAEGATDSKEILKLRQRQMRNFMVALFLSHGTPMLLMGDEYGHTRKGNNNTWCQDNELNWFLWNEKEENKIFFEFVSQLIQFRKDHSIFSSPEYWKDIEWHGVDPGDPKWSEAQIAFTLKGQKEAFYIAFNASNDEKEFHLPEADWSLHLATYQDRFLNKPQRLETPFLLPPYSSIVAMRNLLLDEKK